MGTVAREDGEVVDEVGGEISFVGGGGLLLRRRRGGGDGSGDGRSGGKVVVVVSEGVKERGEGQRGRERIQWRRRYLLRVGRLIIEEVMSSGCFLYGHVL